MAAKDPEQKNTVEQKLIELSRRSDEEIFKEFKTDPEGLNQVEAGERLEEYGRNIIDAGNENSLFKRVREAVINPFNIVLLAVSGVTLVTDVILADKPNWATFLMLVFVIIVSGVISFVIKGGRETAMKFMDSLQLASNEVHVADIRTCVLHPASETHRQLTDEQLVAAGIDGGLVRFSVGLENVDDIIADIEKGFAAIR